MVCVGMCRCCVSRYSISSAEMALARLDSRGDPPKITPSVSRSVSMKSLPGGRTVDLSIANLLEREKAEEQTPWLEEVRLKVKKFIATSFFGHLYVNTLLVLSILSCLQYLYSTYLESSSRADVRLPFPLALPLTPL